MDPERWQRLDDLFQAALDHGPEEQSDFLERACAGDPAMRRQLEALLRADAESRGFLDAPPRFDLDPAQGATAAGEVAAGGAACGERIGPYRIVRQIGRGGMGTVYLAERADQVFERRVAVKVLTSDSVFGMPYPGDLDRRFKSERQILAALEHPSIARLYDGGTTADGRPYLVMEHVDGVAIDVYCNHRNLALRPRLELFRKVCSAVHHAHQHLVVHRDLKPSNILVDAAGEPKLLDFGIAKLLDPESFPLTVEVTPVGLRPMTPTYASPEQVRGEAISTASDVYSLGVLLYELLTGRLPHRFERLTRAQIERFLATEPEKPSAVAPGPLRRQLAGDLDSIVLMALHRQPERRYGSAEQLSEDLGRHLAGLPVSARKDSVGYHLSTFLRRHKLAVAFAASLLALAVAFAGAMTWRAAEIARQRDRAVVQRQRAEERREQAFEQATPAMERALAVLRADGRDAEAAELEARWEALAEPSSTAEPPSGE